MDKYSFVELTGYIVSGASLFGAVIFFFFGKIPEKIRLLRREKSMNFSIVKSEVYIHTKERIGDKKDERKKNGMDEQTADFKYFYKQPYRTTKLNG